MKKILITIFTFCFAAFSVPQSYGNNSNKIDENSLKKNNDIESFSYGLYYKNQAIENLNNSDKVKYLDKAIEYFTKSLESGKVLHRVYYHLAECYYHKYDFNLAIHYSEKSIEVDNRFLEPYKLIYKINLSMRRNDKAAEILERYIKVNPDYIFIIYKLGEHYYLKMNDMNKSMEKFKQVVELSNKEAVDDYFKERSYYFLGYISYRLKKIDDSINYFKKVLEVNHENLNAVYLLAIINMEQYRINEAEFYADEYLKKSPEDSMMLLVKGRIMYLKDTPGSIRYIRKGKSLGSMEGWIANGLYHELIKKDERAEDILAKLVKLKPELIEPYLGLAKINVRNDRKNSAFNNLLSAGILLYKNKMYFEAITCFTDAVALNNKVAGVYYYLGRAYEELSNYSLAIVYFKKAHELKPENELLLHVGYLHAMKKDYDAAIKIFDQVSNKNPNDSRSYFFRGLVSLWQKDYPFAERNIRKAISIDEKSETYYFYLAIVLEKQSRTDEAVENLEKAIKYDPKSARSYNYLGYLYADKNIKIDRSLYLIKKALELEPDNGAYIDSLGWVYFRKGDYQAALENLLKAEMLLKKINSPDAVVFDHIGDTYEKLKKYNKAIKYWEKALKIKEETRIKNKINKLKKETEK